jgi:hypothetical protein
MLSTPNADKAWKGMTRSFPTPEAPGPVCRPEQGGEDGLRRAAAWTGARSGGADASQWLLLRDRTAKRL